MRFQDNVAAWFAVRVLAESAAAPVAGLPKHTTLEFLLAETTQPTDDLNVGTSADGRVFVQAKTTLSLSSGGNSDLRKVFDQFIRQFVAGITSENQPRLFDVSRDRLVLVIGIDAPATIRKDLRKVLQRLESASAAILPNIIGAMSGSIRAAYDVLRTLYDDLWPRYTKTASSDEAFIEFVQAVRILVLDFTPDGADMRAADELLRRAVLHDPAQSGDAWKTIADGCRNLSPERTGAHREYLRRLLQDAAITLAPQRSYSDDIAQARRYTKERLAYLRKLSVIRFTDAPNGEIKIQRHAQTELATMANDGHVLVIGEPGAGKSGCIHDVAAALASNHDTLVVPVDRVDNASNLREEIGLTHAFTLAELLANWSGPGPAYLFIDALDAARTRGSLQRLCDDLQAVMERAPRWHIVTSIREFDLQHSRDAQRLFRGAPHKCLRSDRFPRVRHIQVPLLDDEALGSVEAQAIALGSAVTRGGPSLKSLARNLFNLRLLAELVETLGEGGLTPIRTQLELLDLYWMERVERSDANPVLRRQLLHRAVDAMKRSRKLTTPKPPLIKTATDDAPCYEQLLSDGIIVETAAPIPGASQDISFAHNILFDYAIARLWIQDLPDNVIDELAHPAHDDLLLAIRPSIDIAFRRLWHETHGSDRALFWARTFDFQRTRLVGRIIPAAVAASGFNVPADVARLVDAVVGDLEHAASILGYTVTAAVMMDDDGGSEFALLGRATSAWMELASTLATRAAEKTAWQVRILLAKAMRGHEQMTPTERVHAGDAARRLLRLALSDANNRSVMPIAISVVCQTADTNSGDAIQVLAPLLERDELAESGHQTLEDMTEHFDMLVVADPDFALRLASTTFSTYASRDEQVPIGSRILPLTFNKHDMLEMARRHIADRFPAVMRHNTIAGIRIAARILAEHSMHDRGSGLPKRYYTFRFAGGPATLRPDHSHIWAGRDYVKEEAWWKVLRALYEGLHSTAAESPEAIPGMLNEFRENFELAAGWDILLQAAATAPDTLGIATSELLTTREILEEEDTRVSSGKLIRAIYPALSYEQRQGIEKAIMLLADPADDEPPEYCAHRRDRILGCIPVGFVATDAARARLEKLISSNAVPSNERQRFGGFATVSEAERLEEQGIEVAAPQNREIREQTERVKSFRPAGQDEVLSLDQVAEFFPTARELGDKIQDADSLGIDRRLAQDAREHLIECCERMAHAKGMVPSNPAFPFIRGALLEAVIDPVPEPQERDDRWDTSTPGWGSPSPRISAAIGLMALARNPETIDQEVRAGIQQLLTDPHPAVRYQIARRCLMLWVTDRPLMWQLIDHFASKESRLTILSFFIDGVLLRLGRDERERAGTLIQRIYRRTRRDPRASKIRELAAKFFLQQAIWYLDRRSERRLRVYADRPRQFPSELGRIIALCRGLLVHEDPGASGEENARVREWAVRILHRTLQSVLQELRKIRERYIGSPQWPEEAIATFRTLHSLADSIGNQVYFASGAFAVKEDQDDEALEPKQLARFAKEIDPLLDLLCEVEFVNIAYNVLKLLQHLAPLKPERVFHLLGKLVVNSSRDGIQYESMATDLVVEIVEQYLADRRDLFLVPDMRSTLLSVLDRFVEAGWPKAARLTFRLSEVYR